ncbi:MULTISPECIES: hypothetical protein [unclassified Mucilaginibacter]|nr:MULTISPECIES: hypothetical protein [unclassified Mucilaginibacter]MEB0262112.1 hypothetical protein [Mucilaginibacter sp. 10I4]MEB0278778.1 hypothetical protein [Mucilaginibacter sp. 10B2]MEB0299857.1 hypothetical protein [Mucilaginibacter sp. 5C4]WPX21961.1 hypothetical protein RHM67_11775 [Mucilaginibacter sp. 5C4]
MRFVFQTYSNKPLQADALMLQNKKGKQLSFFINFTEEPLDICFTNEPEKLLLPPTSIIKNLHL